MAACSTAYTHRLALICAHGTIVQSESGQHPGEASPPSHLREPGGNVLPPDPRGFVADPKGFMPDPKGLRSNCNTRRAKFDKLLAEQVFFSSAAQQRHQHRLPWQASKPSCACASLLKAVWTDNATRLPCTASRDPPSPARDNMAC